MFMEGRFHHELSLVNECSIRFAQRVYVDDIRPTRGAGDSIKSRTPAEMLGRGARLYAAARSAG